MINKSFDRTKLSYRENEILELAIDGLTDQQIALRLDISPSTVNSYWVRIRGKLGHFSRTELVSAVLRQQAKNEVDRLNLSRAELERRLSLGEAHRGNVPDQAILDATPEPLMAIDGEGSILYANQWLADLFGYCIEELIGKPVGWIVPERDRYGNGIDLFRSLEVQNHRHLGLESLIFGRRKDGHTFRITVSIGSAESPKGTVHTCIVRSFNGEIDHLRRRASSALTHFRR